MTTYEGHIKQRQLLLRLGRAVVWVVIIFLIYHYKLYEHEVAVMRQEAASSDSLTSAIQHWWLSR